MPCSRRNPSFSRKVDRAGGEKKSARDGEEREGLGAEGFEGFDGGLSWPRRSGFQHSVSIFMLLLLRQFTRRLAGFAGVRAKGRRSRALLYVGRKWEYFKAARPRFRKMRGRGGERRQAGCFGGGAGFFWWTGRFGDARRQWGDLRSSEEAPRWE